MTKNDNVAVGQRWVIRRAGTFEVAEVVAKVERNGRTLWVLRSERTGRDIKPHAATFLRTRREDKPA